MNIIRRNKNRFAQKKVAAIAIAATLSIQATDTFAVEVDKWGNDVFGYASFREDAVEACKYPSIGIIPGLYYDGANFDFFNQTNERSGVCHDTNGNTIPIWRDCDDGTSMVNRDCRQERIASCTVGNPTEVVTRVKREAATDWVSSVDPRFSLTRNYRSDTALSREFAHDHVFDDMAGLWRFNYNEYVNGTEGSQWFAMYQSGDGTSVNFEGQVTVTPVSTGHEYTARSKLINGVVLDEYVVETGDGTRRFIPRLSGLGEIYAMRRIKFPDGYGITINRNSSNRVTNWWDNRGQRIDFFWSTSAVPNSNVEVVTRAEIDVDHRNSQFIPDIAIHYTYEQNTVIPHRPKLIKVESEDLATSVKKTIWEYEYAPDNAGFPHKLLTIKDARQNGSGQHFPYATFTYEDGGYGTSKVVSSTHHNGADSYTFAETANVVSITNPLGKQTEYTTGFSGDREVITSVDGIATANCLATTRSQDYTPTSGAPDGYVYEGIERNGAKTTYDRDARGLVLTKTEDANGTDPRVTTYTWVHNRRKPLTITTDHRIETFTYEDDGRRLKTYSITDNLTGSPTFGSTRTWTYNYEMKPWTFFALSSIDGPGLNANGVTDVTTFTSEFFGKIETATDPNGLVTTVNAFAKSGAPAEIELPDGVEWSFGYDYEGRLTTATRDPNGVPQTTTYAYDEFGQMTSMIDRRGQTWSFEYDEARRLVKTIAPSGDEMAYTHDAMGNITRMEYSDGINPATFYQDTQFDELGRIMKSLGANSQERDFDYDVEDNLTHVTDALSYQTVRGFDSLNRVTSVVDRASYTTTFDVDEADQVTKYTDPRTIATDFVYNGFGEVIQEISQDRGTITYTYNDRGLVASMTDGRGVVTNYEYDDGGRLTAKRFPATPSQDQTFTYDYVNGGNVAGRGKPDTTTDPSGTSTARYDQATGLIDTDTRVIEGQSYVTSYDFDAEDAATKVTYPSGHELNITRDVDGRITDMSFDLMGGGGPSSVISGATYLPNGPVTSMTYGDGAVHTATYDSSYRLTDLTDDLSGTLLRDIDMGWTTRDNVSSILDQIDSLRNQNFTYSARELLLSATGSYDQLDFAYDGSGNRISRAVTDFSTLTDTYSYPAGDNRLSSIAEAGGHTRAFTYDAAGNVTYDNRSGGGYGYTYDAAGRMASFAINGVTQAEYVYNAAGQQVIRRLTQAGQTIHALFDLDGNRIAEYDYDPIALTSTLLREYIWMDGRAVAVVEGGVIYFIRTDHIGRPSFATDGVGTKVWEATYLPFGGLHTSTGTPIALRFPGQWFQSDSGLYQNWMRDYDPTTGRYIQADPLGLVDGASVYGYALQNPLVHIDPNGLDAFIYLNDTAVMGLGHVGIGTNKNETYGHYCGDNATCLGWQDGETRKDNVEKMTRMLQISLSDEDTQELQKCIDRRLADPGRYHILRRSCVDFVRDCLAEVRISLPNLNRPDMVYERLYQRSDSKEIANRLQPAPSSQSRKENR